MLEIQLFLHLLQYPLVDLSAGVGGELLLLVLAAHQVVVSLGPPCVFPLVVGGAGGGVDDGVLLQADVPALNPISDL